MKDSVFLSYPKPYLEKQKQFIEKVVSYAFFISLKQQFDNILFLHSIASFRICFLFNYTRVDKKTHRYFNNFYGTNLTHLKTDCLLVLLQTAAVPRYTAQSAENLTALSRSQRSARLARHRRSGGSIADALPQMLSAAF